MVNILVVNSRAFRMYKLPCRPQRSPHSVKFGIFETVCLFFMKVLLIVYLERRFDLKSFQMKPQLILQFIQNIQLIFPLKTFPCRHLLYPAPFLHSLQQRPVQPLFKIFHFLLILKTTLPIQIIYQY